MRYAITGFPNTERFRAIVDNLRPENYHQKKRGRGCRMGKQHWHQSIPLKEAMYFTLYGAKVLGKDRWGGYKYEPFISTRAHFVKVDKSGKLRLRLVWLTPKEQENRMRHIDFYVNALTTRRLAEETWWHYFKELHLLVMGEYPNEEATIDDCISAASRLQ
jgi:hypothetical protein